MSITSTSATGVSTNAVTNPLTAISSNYNEFLTLLTTQLQNQDPSNPTDTSQFTSELAQFAGVEQQVSTNTNLTSLIQLTQSQQMLQGSAILGKQVDLNSTTLPLQNSAAQLTFTSPSAQPVTIAVSDSSGNVLTTQTVNAAAGTNGWSWNGESDSGVAEPNGPYTVAVSGASSTGTATPLSFTTRGTVTGVSQNGSGINLTLGASTVSMSSVADVEN